MKAPHRWTRIWRYALPTAALGVVGYGAGQRLGGGPLIADPVGALSVLPPDPMLSDASGGGLISPADEVESVVLAQRKRIVGRLRSLEMVRRVATHIRPHVDRAIEQPSIQAELRYLAGAADMSPAEYKEYFKGKQEADLLLESGGDPNAHSVSDAIGVAQYLAGTGRRAGLKIDTAAAQPLSREIRRLEKQIEALEAQPPTWTREVPPALAGVVPTVPVPGTAASSADASQVPAPTPQAIAPPPGVWARDQWIAYRKMQRQKLVARRRVMDERYDPAKAIASQTRYLVKLTRQFGGIDWALQAYHGGEAGASRTIRLFTEAGGHRALLASRGVSRPYGLRLSYSELYRRVTPTGTPAAFSYLFGRSDDHRYYWWKVMMAERALDFYRKDPDAFEKLWQALKPGLSADVVFYPEPEALQFADNAALRAGYQSGALVPLPRNAASLGLRTENLAVLTPDAAHLHKGLRPESMGALLRLVHLYRGFGGSDPLTVVSMVQSQGYRDLWRERYPDRPLPPGVPRDPDFQPTGLVFQIKRPTRDWDRKVLEYSLGRLYDSLRISWRSTSTSGSRRYYVVVNPAYKSEMAEYYAKAIK